MMTDNVVVGLSAVAMDPWQYPPNPCHGYGFGPGYEIRTRTRTRTNPWPRPARVCKPVTIPNGTRIVSGSEDKSVRVWDASTGAELMRFNGHTYTVNSVAFSTDGTQIGRAHV